VFLLAALLFELVCLFNSSATFAALYRLVGLQEGHAQMFRMATAANFINLIAPSGGLGGLAVFLDSARRRSIPPARVVVVGILYLLYEYAATFCILAPGFLVLASRHTLNRGELAAAGLLLAITLGAGLMLFLAHRSSERLGRLLARFAQLANACLRPFLHRDHFKTGSAHEFSRELAEGIEAIRGGERRLLWPLLFTLNNKVLLLCVLAFTFLALNTPFTLGTLLGGFSISMLFIYISPTPLGVGMVESILPAALSALSVPFTEALLITLAFRGLTVWFPLAVGGLSFRSLQKQALSEVGKRTPSETVGV
jgi:uncharacterized protein (TIRG00374 family)